MYLSIAALVWTPIAAFSAVKGRNRVNDCRAFNVRLSEEQRRDAQAQATYNWLDEFSPALELGVAPNHPVTLGVVALLMGAVGLTAAWVPARAGFEHRAGGRATGGVSGAAPLAPDWGSRTPQAH